MSNMDPKYSSLFTPWKIRDVEIKNRIVLCPMGGDLAASVKRARLHCLLNRVVQHSPPEQVQDGHLPEETTNECSVHRNRRSYFCL